MPMLGELWIQGVRNLAEGRLEPGAGLNVLVGPNGSGKTSLLEACHILGLGRSFRTPRLGRVAHSGGSQFSVAGNLVDSHRVRSRVAVEWSGERRSRLNGQWLDGHWEIARRMPVVAVHADSFDLLVGAPEERRRLLDWGGFYLHPEFPAEWKAWRRAHEQRNAALRNHDEGSAKRFERFAATSGERLTGMRSRFVTSLDASLRNPFMADVKSGLQGDIEIGFRQGWPEGETLAEAYDRSRASDLERGFGQTGPQKADIEIRLAGRAIRDASRGEQKRVLNALVVSQGNALVSNAPGEVSPVLLLDDAVAEMDQFGLTGMMSMITKLGWQCLVTSVDQGWATAVASDRSDTRMFHVEHGVVTPA